MFSGWRSGSARDCSIVRRAEFRSQRLAQHHRDCARIVAEAESAEQAARALQREPRGMLSMSAPDTFGPMHVAPAIPEFLARFPDLPSTFRSRPGTSIWCRRALTSPFALERSKIFRSSCAGWHHPLRPCAAPAYFKMRGAPRVPDDLLHHACFGVSLMPWRDEWHLVGAKGEHRIAAGGVLRSNSADILRAAALSGLGIALLPSWAVGDDLRSGTLTRILPGCEPPPSAVYAVYPSNRLMSAKVRAFVDHLARRIGRMPYWDKGL